MRKTLIQLTLIFFTVSCHKDQLKISNPYQSVNWGTYLQIKASLHTHTTESDGAMTPSEVIDRYWQLGYRVLALTDHNTVTWPWSKYDQDEDSLNMVAIQGSEPSRHHHIVTYFCDVPGRSSLSKSLSDVQKQNGLAIMAHPGRYNWSKEGYINCLNNWRELIGMEIYNKGDRYPEDRILWDSILTIQAPHGRPVWGFSNDDMHRKSHLGRNWTILLLPELSSEAVRKSLETGSFLYVYSPDGHRGDPPPTIKEITVNNSSGTIKISAEDYTKIEWISGGDIIHTGENLQITDRVISSGYVRAVIYADNRAVGTQPFFIEKRGSANTASRIIKLLYTPETKVAKEE